MTKTYWITDSRFKWISLLLFLMFLVFMLLIFMKADEITRNPCQICAGQSGEDVVCYAGTQARIFHSDYSIEDKVMGG